MRVLRGVVATYPTHTNDQRTSDLRGGCPRQTAVGWRSGAPSVDSARPLSTAAPGAMRVPFDHRRRRWRTFATTLALTLGSLAVPAAALADGQLDPAFNGTGYHVGTVAEGTVFTTPTTGSRWSSRPMAASSSAARAAALMTLARYNVNGTLDTTFGVGGFATASSPARPAARAATAARPP